MRIKTLLLNKEPVKEVSKTIQFRIINDFRNAFISWNLKQMYFVAWAKSVSTPGTVTVDFVCLFGRLRKWWASAFTYHRAQLVKSNANACNIRHLPENCSFADSLNEDQALQFDGTDKFLNNS